MSNLTEWNLVLKLIKKLCSVYDTFISQTVTFSAIRQQINLELLTTIETFSVTATFVDNVGREIGAAEK